MQATQFFFSSFVRPVICVCDRVDGMPFGSAPNNLCPDVDRAAPPGLTLPALWPSDTDTAALANR